MRDATHGRTFPRQRFSLTPYALKIPVDGTTVNFNAAGQLQLVTPVNLTGGNLSGVTVQGATITSSTLTSSSSIGVGPSAAACAAGNEGHLRYDATGKRMEFCNGMAWTAMASEASAVPAGTIAFFALASCPTGWAEYTALQGRVAVAASTQMEAAVGTALTSQGTRTINQVAAHTHAVDPPSTLTSENGWHGHGASMDAQQPGFPAQYISGKYNLYGDGPGWVAYTWQENPGHWHNITVTGAGNHQHWLDVGAFNSGSAGAASVDVTMPYLQLRACKKN